MTIVPRVKFLLVLRIMRLTANTLTELFSSYALIQLPFPFEGKILAQYSLKSNK